LIYFPFSADTDGGQSGKGSAQTDQGCIGLIYIIGGEVFLQ